MGSKGVYMAQLNRFGYALTTVGRTKKEAVDTVIATYINYYRSENGTDPDEDYVDWTEPITYLELAKKETFVTFLDYGHTKWL